MFFYVSFLRPPPVQSTLSGTIFVTPQIANDLRTEQYDGSEDIYYSWSLVAPQQTNQASVVITRPAKLTTWRQSSAYKEIPVPLPNNIKDGQSWRLILTANRPLSSPQLPAIELHDSDLGKVAFPVLSAPIYFSNRNAGKSRKQEQIERVYEVRSSVQGVEAVRLRLVEQTSFDLDKKIWDSGIGLSSWIVSLHKTPSPELSPTLVHAREVLFGKEPRNVIELGTGIGIVSLTLASLRALDGRSPDSRMDRIVATDLDSAMPILERNITNNKNNFPENNVTAAVLNWDEPLPSFTAEFSTGLDVIIMADVTYNTSSFPSLIRTLSNLLKLATKPPLIVLGYKERDSAERSLWQLAEQIGLGFEKLDEREGAGGAPIEVWVGSVGN